MTSKDAITELTVAKLFANGQYAIPTYQRNFAWGEPEVKQLLQDVLDVALHNRHKLTKNKNKYYIGSLVVDDKGHQTFETIDGQQRHTTLSIILSVLKNEFAQQVQLPEGLTLNLSFNSRKKSANTLAMLFDGKTEGCEQPSMLGAYQVANSFLKEVAKEQLSLFTDYLLNRVIILRVSVPEKTDLNHYFEIMNNRGEQLEKHEVLKARLMGSLNNQAEQRCFAEIWDACASMDRYVQLGFTGRPLRDKLFGKDWSRCPANFVDVYEHLKVADRKSDDTSSGPPKMSEIIKDPQLRERRGKKADVDDDPGRYSSIINVPNFLLQVLRVTTKQDLPLDDKRLLSTFDANFKGMDKAEKAAFAREFVIDLLKCRMLLDRYIIKRKNETEWSLEALKRYEEGHGFVNTADEPLLNKQLIMLLSMFHVSFPTQVYKHWLSAALHFLVSNTGEGKSVSATGYRDFLEALNDRFFYGRYGKGEPINYRTLTFSDDAVRQDFDMENLNQRTHIQNFIFNRLDYLLWKKLEAGEAFAVDKMEDVKKRAARFSFTFRTSVEHYFPQHPLAGEPMDEAILHSFGNLCLISHSNNSRVSNFLPRQKNELYERSDTESLKLAFMMSSGNWGPEHPDVVAEHERMMVEVLCGRARVKTGGLKQV